MPHEDSPKAPADPALEFTAAPQQAIVLRPVSAAYTAVACIGGLLIPGLGHLVLKRWVRGALLLASVLLLFVIGLGMQGELYRPPPAGEWMSFRLLGMLANIGVGLPYFFAVSSGFGLGLPTARTFDYGWAYLIVAGLLNYLIVLDAFDIARGRKP
jgi:hypothetical protein